MKVDFEHFRGNDIADLEIRNMEQEAKLNLIRLLNPQFSKDGDQFVYLYGDNLHDGIAGFGSTVSEAVDAFWMAFHNEKAVGNQN